MSDLIKIHKSNWDELKKRASILETQVGLLTVLARGCKAHRAYRAIRQPQVLCGMCTLLYSAAEDLRRVEVKV